MIQANDDYQTIIHPLDPVYNHESKVLILGSFPSVKTRKYGFFYGHPQNRFWPLMEALFEVDLSREIPERKAFLLDHHLAVYDSIYQCDIIGSADASIQNVVPSDLNKIIQESTIQAVFCNGSLSYKTYQKYQAKETGIPAQQVPSTSPANARYRLEDLVTAWQKLLDYLV